MANAEITVVCTETDCKHHDGNDSCTIDTVTIGTGGQCEDFEEG